MNELLSSILSLFGLKSSTPKLGNAEVLSLPPDAMEAVQHNYRFHTRLYRRLLRLAIGQILVIIALTAGCIWIVITATPNDRFFVASSDGRITQIIPIDMPLQNNSEMISRVADAVSAALTFGYLDYDQRRVEVGNSFTIAALDKLQAPLLKGRGPAILTDDARIYTAAVNRNNPGAVISQGINKSNVYQWVIQVNLTLTTQLGFDDPPKKSSIPVTIVLLVERARAVEIQRGFIIKDVRQSSLAPTTAPGARP